MNGMCEWESMIDIMSKHTAPDDWRIKNFLRKSLKDAHHRYNESKKLIPVYQAAIQHWVDVQREYQVEQRMYLDMPKRDYSQFKSTSEIKELRKELRYLLKRCKNDKHYFHKARQNYVEFLEFKKACEGSKE